MAHLKPLGRFVAIAAVVLGALRLAHVAAPLAFPETRRGHLELADLGAVARYAGFAPIVPAYRPATLGDRPVAITVSFRSRVALIVRWQQDERTLVVTQQRWSGVLDAPPLARPLDNTAGADAVWWSSDGRAHALVRREGFRLEIETTLPLRELRRMVDTLAVWR